jgi:type I restriction-modification system DNA methylase subunit
MTLREAIQKILIEQKRPLPASVIAAEINAQGLYDDPQSDSLQSGQILSSIKNYPALFQNINGHIILVEDKTWKNLLTSYWYLVDILKGIYNVADIQFIIAVLFYYKRLLDINNRPGHQYPIEPRKGTDIGRLLDNGHLFIEKLNNVEEYHIGPEGVFDECARLLMKLERGKRHEIEMATMQLDTRDIKDGTFGIMYEYFLTLDSIEKYKLPENHTPYSLRELMTNLLNAKEGQIYDPVAGIGGLLTESVLQSGNSKLKAIGTEINARAAQLGNMNLLMHSLKQATIETGDCFKQITNKNLYDYIIGDIPAYGITSSWEHVHLYGQYGLEAPKSGKSFGSLVLLALSKLKENGKAVLTVSDGFLVKKGKEKEIRDLLIKKDVIETIISLPYGTLRPYTDAKASILILNKQKSAHLEKRIQFINAKIADQNAKFISLNNEEIIQAYRDKDTQKNELLVSIDDLRPDTNLSADAYDAQFMIANQLLKENKGKLLADLVEIRSGINPDKVHIDPEGGIPLIKIEDLSKEILDLNLKTKVNHYVTNSQKYARATVYDDCILIARIGDSIKPTIFHRGKIPGIIIHTNVYALIPKSDLNLEYLYYQLHSAFVEAQIEKRKLGAVMPYVSMAGLREIVIPYMNLESQRNFIDSQKANLIAEERKRVEERIKALGYQEETKQAESAIISTLTHQLRPTFLEVSNLVNRITRIIEREKLQHFIERNEQSKRELIDPEIADHIITPDNFTLQQLLQKLSADSNHLSDILSNVDKVMNFKLTQENLKKVDILAFIKSYKEQKEVESNKTYSISVKGDSAHVLVNKSAFKELLDQLLLNAEKHAFPDTTTKDSNKIEFNVRYNRQREVASIIYTNNGIPYELSQKDFTTAFEKGNKSKGSGIGGNYIFRIVEAHNGKLIVAEDYTDGFMLTIELPAIKNQKDE